MTCLVTSLEIVISTTCLILLEAHSQGVGLNDLAAEFDVSLRTIYRDLAALQEAGYPLYTEETGNNSVCSLSRDILGVLGGRSFTTGSRHLSRR
jgi:predicted DNA-binding transcriptional regulator YafY